MALVNVSKSGVMTGHKDCVYTLARSPHPSLFFSAGGDGMVVQWDLENPNQGQLVARVPNSVYALHYLPERDLLVVGHNYEGIHLIDWQNRQEVGSLKCAQGAIFDITSYDGNLYIGDSSGTLIIADPDSLRVLDTRKYSEKSLRTIAIHETRREIAMGFSDNTIRIADANNLTVKEELKQHTNSVFTLAFQNNQLFSAGRDAHLRIWDVSEGYKLHEDIVAHMYAINHLSFSPDDKHFVTCSMDKSIKVWDAESFRLLKVIDKARHAGHGTSVNRTLWLDDLLISASDDRTISAWDLEFNY